MIKERWASIMIINLNYFLLNSLANNKVVNEVSDLRLTFAFLTVFRCASVNHYIEKSGFINFEVSFKLVSSLRIYTIASIRFHILELFIIENFFTADELFEIRGFWLFTNVHA